MTPRAVYISEKLASRLMCLQTGRTRGGDIDHSDMMRVIPMALVMMNMWMRVAAEVFVPVTELESVIFAHR